MSEMSDRICKALIDADPTMRGYHEEHMKIKLPYALAVLDALEIPTESMFIAGQVADPGVIDCRDVWREMLAEAKK